MEDKILRIAASDYVAYRGSLSARLTDNRADYADYEIIRFDSSDMMSLTLAEIHRQIIVETLAFLRYYEWRNPFVKIAAILRRVDNILRDIVRR